jgi:hypothetical protein
MSDWAEGNGHRELPRPGTGRRRSLITLMVLLVALPVTFVVSSLLGPGWGPVISVERLEREGIIYVPAALVFVVSTENGPVALSARSPHLGHRLLFCRSAQYFQGRHGESFDRDGTHAHGPSPRDLDRLGVRVRDGLVEVNPEMVTRGSASGSEIADRPVGPVCRVPGPEDPPGFAAEPVGPAQ